MITTIFSLLALALSTTAWDVAYFPTAHKIGHTYTGSGSQHCRSVSFPKGGFVMARKLAEYEDVITFDDDMCTGRNVPLNSVYNDDPLPVEVKSFVVVDLRRMDDEAI
ncbi:hypothetical protein N7533_013627 [Penicillium manginii]|jgi:hypothetical protein|uniref:uncharacterized protein n=1 Tax=Penicillium manginii TaxID=203109 RepID=UPI0025466720|nr:uncharacterized protein N7533_013627 [Penicillium manginii]KAJ5733180.1 hypothetical protein N7533_013627 [Penicillium manginii]